MKPDPQVVLIVSDPSMGLLGYMVIDRMIHGKACGGIRILPDVSLEEVKTLARCMTLKFGFAGKATGGAKAGVIMPAGTLPAERHERLLCFGEAISPYLKSGAYMTGPDMGSTEADIATVYEGAGIKPGVTKEIKSNFHTALSVMIALEAAAAFKKIDLAHAAMAIEGFGAVGSTLATVISEHKNTKIVAISTAQGAIYQPEGLNINRLMQLREEHGDALVMHYPETPLMKREELFGLPVDILSPCARQEAIHLKNVGDIQARIICGGANYPVARDAEFALHQVGILSIPHFIASSGAVIGGKLEGTGWGDNFIEHFIRDHYQTAILELLTAAEHAGEPPLLAAETYAMNRFKHMQTESQEEWAPRMQKKIVRRLIDHKIIPPELSRQMADAYFDGLPN